MNELLAAAKAVIDWWDDVEPSDLPIEQLIAAVERAEKQEADFYKWWERTYGGKTCMAFAEDAWKTAQRFERDRIRARVQMAAEQVWKAGDLYIGPQHANMEKFVDALLEDGDE